MNFLIIIHLKKMEEYYEKIINVDNLIQHLNVVLTKNEQNKNIISITPINPELFEFEQIILEPKRIGFFEKNKYMEGVNFSIVYSNKRINSYSYNSVDGFIRDLSEMINRIE